MIFMPENEHKIIHPPFRKDRVVNPTPEGQQAEFPRVRLHRRIGQAMELSGSLGALTGIGIAAERWADSELTLPFLQSVSPDNRFILGLGIAAICSAVTTEGQLIIQHAHRLSELYGTHKQQNNEDTP